MDQIIANYLERISDIPDTSLDEEQRLAAEIALEDNISVERLAEAHLKNAAKAAHLYYEKEKWRGLGEEIDYIEAANVGLMLAVRKYKGKERFWEFAEPFVHKALEKLN